MLERLLEANNPEKFKRRSDVNHKFNGDINQLSIEELENLERSILAAHPQLALESAQVVETTAELVQTQST